MKLATLIYVRKNGKTLMMHRIKKKGDIHWGKWNGLGGKFAPGESPEECAVREAWEESGLRLARPRLRGVLTFPGFDGEDDWYVYVFVATRYRGRLRSSREGRLAWIPDEDLLALPLWPGDRIFLKWLDRPEFFSGTFVYRRERLVSHRAFFY